MIQPSPIKGKKIVRFAYMDESGISSCEQEKYAVESAVVVHVDQDYDNIVQDLSSIYDEFILPQHRENFILHTKSLFSGEKRESGKVFDKDLYPIEKRIDLAERISMIFVKYELVHIFGWCDKDQLSRSFDFSIYSKKEQTAQLHNYVFLQCASLVDLWVKYHAPGEKCFLALEDNGGTRKHIKSLHQSAQSPPEGIAAIESSSPLFEFVVEDPLFMEKRSPHPLELADFAAYIWRKKLEGNDKYERFIKILEPQSLGTDEMPS